MPDELLGPLFDDLGLHQRPEGSHDAAKEMAATSQPCVLKQHSEAPMAFQGSYQEANYKSVYITQ